MAIASVWIILITDFITRKEYRFEMTNIINEFFQICLHVNFENKMLFSAC